MKTLKNKLLATFFLVGGVAAALTSGAHGLQAQTVQTDYEDGGLYIRLKADTRFAVKSGENRTMSAGRFAFLKPGIQAYGIRELVESQAFGDNELLARTLSVTIDSIDKIDAFIAYLYRQPEVELVEKRPMYYICGETAGLSDAAGATPALTEEAAPTGDPIYEMGFHNHKWHLDQINADSAWTLATGKPYIKVAVVDNAIWSEHEDLLIDPANTYNIHSNEANSNPPESTDQNQTCGNLDNCPPYAWSHGTHCAGNVGAIRNNGKGVAAIGSGVTVMGVRCATNSIPGAVSNGFAGVRWAAEHGAKVISLSWGSYSLPSQTEQEILKTCYDQGIILVAAAGNNHSTSPFYPAASPYVISVGATNSDKIHANEFSNYGKWVDILAPGGFIKRGNQKTNYSVMSTTFGLNQCYRLDCHDNSFAGQYYDGMFGTSMATPIAASLCGLLLSVDSTLDAPRMRELLASSAQILSENEAYVRDGSGLIDAFAAIKMLLASRPAPDPVRYTILPPKGVELTWDAPKGDNLPAVAHYRVYRNGSLVKDRLQETAFTDGDLRYGNYSYAVEAVFEDQSVSLKNGVDFAMPQYRLIDAVIAPDSTWGQVTGTGYYVDGDTAVLEAIPADGYVFVRWNDRDEILGRDPICKIGVRYPLTLTATFRKGSANESRMAAAPLTVYPNPTDGLLHVENLPEGDYEGGVFDLQGRQLIPLHVQGGATLEIPVARLTKGTYIVKLTAADGQVRMAKFQKM